MRMFLAIAGLTCSALAGAQTIRVHRAGTDVEFPYHTIFFASASLPYERLPLSAAWKTSALEALIPKRPGTFGMAELRCAGVAPDRHLLGCTLKVEPRHAGYEGAARALARDLVVAPSYPLGERPPIRFISVQLKMWNSDRAVGGGPCWPPGCSPF